MPFRQIGTGFQSGANNALGFHRVTPICQQQSVGELGQGIVASAQVDRLLESLQSVVFMIQMRLGNTYFVECLVVIRKSGSCLIKVDQTAGNVALAQTLEAAMEFILSFRRNFQIAHGDDTCRSSRRSIWRRGTAGLDIEGNFRMESVNL